MYPWSLFVFLTVGLMLRSWMLTLAFQGGEGSDGSFQPYFLIPIVLAWSALIVEVGRARQSRAAMAAGLCLPLAAIGIAFPGSGGNPLAIGFLNQLTAAIGSPAQIAIWGCVCFYGYAWLRGLAIADLPLILSGVLASMAGVATLDPLLFTAPNPVVLGGVAAVMFVTGIARRTTWRVALGGGMVLAALPLSPVGQMGDAAQFWIWHAPVLGALSLALVLDDDLARWLRAIAWRVAPILALATISYPLFFPTNEAVLGYAAVLTMFSIGFWLRDKRVPELQAMLGTLAVNCLAHLRHLYILLEASMLGRGLPWLLAGLVIVAVAFAISLWKMGIWRRVGGWFTAANRALGGTG
jgi:hypothetical protein